MVPLEEVGKAPVGKAPREEVVEPPVRKAPLKEAREAPLEKVGPGVQLYLLTVVHRWVRVGVMGTPVLQSPLQNLERD